MKKVILLFFVINLVIPSTGMADENTETHRYIMHKHLKEAKLNNNYKECEQALKSLWLGKYKSQGNCPSRSFNPPQSPRQVLISTLGALGFVKKGIDICWELKTNDPEVKEEIKQANDQYGIEFTKELYTELIDSDVQYQYSIQGPR